MSTSKGKAVSQSSNGQDSSFDGDAVAGQANNASGGSQTGGDTAAAAAKSRSRTACQNCRSTKQRCDGPSRIPCRRCELYNLECAYADAPQRSLKRKAQGDSTPTAAEHSLGPRPAAIPVDIAQTILQRLEELTARTVNIEDYLRYAPRPHGSVAKRPRLLPGLNELDLGLPDGPATSSHRRMGNPVSTVAENFLGIDSVLPMGANLGPTGDVQGLPSSGPLSPDAVSRGLLTADQAKRYFDFFRDQCLPWVIGMACPDLDDPTLLRTKAPFLFGAVLCVAAYYLDAPNGDPGMQTYLNLVSIVHEILTPIIMAPQASELDDHFVRGMCLCIVWKMPRILPKGIGSANFQQMQNQAKLNNATTYFLAGIMGRASRVSQLYATPSLFMAGDKSPATIDRLRLWIFVCFVDCHGCMQNGRGPSIDITDALKVVRQFATVTTAPGDIETCALFEVSSVYGTFHGASEDDKTDFMALARANTDLDSITRYWYQHYPNLVSHGHFITQHVALFHRMVINADVYRTWSVRNKLAIEAGGTSAPALDTDEAKFLEIAVDSAVTMLLYLTTGARAENGRRVPQFEKPEYWKDGIAVYRPMEPDVEHARQIRCAADTVICVMLCFSAMFLAKLRAADLIRCNLTVVTPETPIKDNEHFSDFEHGVVRVALYSKFFRIIELASDFLEMAAPNAGHPCMTQSRVLRQLLAASTMHVHNMANSDTKPNDVMTSANGHQAQPGLPNPLPLPVRGQYAGQPLPRFSHSLIGQPTIDHSPDSPIAGPDYPYAHHMSAPNSTLMSQNPQLDPQFQMQNMPMMPGMNGTQPLGLSEALTGIGQPGNPLVSSFLGGDEWSMLMASLGLQMQ